MQLGFMLGLNNPSSGSVLSALNLTAPALGDAPIGQPISVDLGVWAPGTSLTADLLRDEVVIQTGLDGSNIVFTPADDEASLVLRVTGVSADSSLTQVARSAPVTARYAPPEIVTAQVPQAPEIYDEDTGPRLLDLAPAFAGEALHFTAAGLTAATIDPVTGVLTTSTDDPVSFGEVIVTAQNSGGSAAVTVEIIVEDEGDTILTPTSMQTSVTDPTTGHVFTFSEAREVGQYQDGTWFVVAGVGDPVDITSISPVSASVSTAAYSRPNNLDDTATVGAETRWMHGTMVNPWAGVGASSGADTGFDNYYGSSGNGIPYVHTVNEDPGATGQPITLETGSIVKSESYPFEGGHTASEEDKTRTAKFSVLTVAPEVPAAGSFRPGPRAPLKTSHWAFADDAAFDARLDATRQKISGFRPFTTEALDNTANRIGQFQQTFFPFQEQARRFNPGSRGHAINIYGGDWYWFFKHAYCAFVGDYTNEEIRPIIRATIQVGIDIYGLLQDDSYYFPWQAHHAGRKGIVFLAGLVLDNQDILDQCKWSVHPEHFGVDDAYTGYVTQNMIGVQSRYYKGKYQYLWEQEHLGLAEWSNVFTSGAVADNAVATYDQVVDADLTNRDYQVLSVGNGATYQALFAMIMDPIAQYFNPAYLDFMDRYIGIRIGDQIDGLWDASSNASGTNDHFTGNWWSINESDADVQDFKTMRDASSRPNYLLSAKPEPLPKPTVTHDGSGAYLDVDFNTNNFQMPKNSDVTITQYDLRWTAYAGGADVATSEDDPEFIGNFEWNVIEDITLPYQLSGVPRGLKVKVQLRMHNANGAGPWMDDRQRESYNNAAVFVGVADAGARGPRYSTNFDVPDTAMFNTAPQNYALPTTSPASLVTGSTISGVEGIWTTNPSITATEYQWQVSDDGSTGWTDISGATSLTFDAASSQEGKHVRFGVRKTNSVGASPWSYSDTTTAVATPLAIGLTAAASGTGDFDPGVGALGGKKLLILFMTRNTDPIALGGSIGAYSFTEADAIYAQNVNSNTQGARERQAAFLLDVPAGEAASVISFTPSLSTNVAAVYELFADLELIESDIDFDGNVAVATETSGMAFFMGRSAGTMGFGGSAELFEHPDSVATSDDYWAFAHSFATTDQGATVSYSQAFPSNTRVSLMSFRIL